jgi:hypothetical protein
MSRPTFVQPRGPTQHEFRERRLKPPCLADLPQEREHGRFDALGLGKIDVITPFHRAHAARPRVLVGQSAEQVVKQSLSQRAVGNAHRLDTKPVEYLDQDRETGRKDFLAIRRQTRHA